jgi:hypothetical protein
MIAAALYQYLEQTFQGKLCRAERQDGVAFYWKQVRTQPSSRLVRISETANGAVGAIKLVQSSLSGPEVFLKLPSSNEEVADAVRVELVKLAESE